MSSTSTPADEPTAQVRMVWQRIRVGSGNNRPGSWEWRQIPASESTLEEDRSGLE